MQEDGGKVRSKRRQSSVFPGPRGYLDSWGFRGEEDPCLHAGKGRGYFLIFKISEKVWNVCCHYSLFYKIKYMQRYFYYVEGSLIIFFQTATTMIDFKSIGNQI